MVSGQRCLSYASPKGLSISVSRDSPDWAQQKLLLRSRVPGWAAVQASDGVFLTLDENNMELPCVNDVHGVQGWGALRDLANESPLGHSISKHLCSFYAGPSTGHWGCHGLNDDCPGLPTGSPSLIDGQGSSGSRHTRCAELAVDPRARAL